MSDNFPTEAEIDAALEDPMSLNDPAAIEAYKNTVASSGGDPEAAAVQVTPEKVAPEDEGEAAVVEAEDTAEGGEEDAGGTSDTAGEDPPAPVETDPATELANAKAEASALRKVLEYLPQVLGSKPEKKAPEPEPLPANVQQWEQLSRIDIQTARDHWEKLNLDGKTFDADRFMAAWQNAPDNLQNWKDRQELRASVEQERTTVRQSKADAEITQLTKQHPDWEKYADRMEDLAKRDAIAQRAGMAPAYATVTDLYYAAQGLVERGKAVQVPLNPRDAGRKAALGRGPQSRGGGGGAARPSSASRLSDEQQLLADLVSDDVRV